jgi:hypothetical protein
MVLFAQEFKAVKAKYGLARADLHSEMLKLIPPLSKNPLDTYLD